MKMCVQYHANVGRPQRTRFLALAGGYHGDTLGAMSVCDPVGGMHHRSAALCPNRFLPPDRRRAKASTPAGKRRCANWPGATATR